ncbi:hypothetical protein Q5P01_001903 [Channa striata]|uniref:phosphatidate phosphatase n=1 Tax=Channa striata TaxID=64152 RepID=A0AA88TD99_CHASR|nr:hypothetical protein Q5P01_001903 [Channa striata]
MAESHRLVGKEHLHPSLWSQTMNIVGQLAETVFVTVKELYSGLNPATLTGGIDVIVVRQPDGSFQCSPFHVRFGKLGVLRSKEKIVDIEINGELVDLHMKLGDNGEAFFVEENENMAAQVPAHLCTSPLPLEFLDETADNPEGTSVAGSGTRRKKRRRRRMRSDTNLREDASSSSEEREREKEWERDSDVGGPESPSQGELVTALQASKSVYYSMTEEPNEELGATQTWDTHPHSDGEQSPSESAVFYSRSSSPKSDSELLVKPQESLGPQIQWNWGGFPTLCQSETTQGEHVSTSGTSHFRTIKRQDSFELNLEPVISCDNSVTVIRPQPRTPSLDLDSDLIQNLSLSEENPFIDQSTPSDLSKSCASSVTNMDFVTPTLQPEIVEVETGDFSPYSTSPNNETNYLDSKKSTVAPAHVSTVSGTISKNRAVSGTEPENDQEQTIQQREDGIITRNGSSSIDLSNLRQLGALTEASEQSSSSAAAGEEDSGIGTCAEGGAEDGGPGVVDGSNRVSLTNKTVSKVEIGDTGVSWTAAEALPNPSQASSKMEKKARRNHHLGPTDIYLDDLTKLDPEVAALYFPKSEADGALQHVAEQGSCSGSQSPQSVGSGVMDSGTEYLSDSTSYNMDISLSLCGQEGDTSQITKEKFMEHIVTYQDFAKNPGLIEDPSLVICINSNYYNWAVAAPMVLSMTAFQKNLPKSTIERLVKDKMPKKSGRWWFWRRRDMDNNQQKPSKEGQAEPLAGASSTVKATLDDMDSDEAAGLGRKAIIPSSVSTETLSTTQCISQMYCKSLRLNSKQIEHLNLREGPNNVVFSVTTQYQGTCRCEAAIYLWNWDDRIIISDIDGTITRSDALGHILPQLGKDWTHKGIAKLYHKIHQNGYKFLYCSARAIGMAAITKNYLQWVNDKGTVLPKGPVLLAPSSLFSALHREVIEKKPEVFKIACLGDIRELFSSQRQPFYAAFGNRSNDAYAYKQIGVPDTRIFTVNPKGELMQEKTKGNKSSYSHLSEMVEHFFPALSVRSSTSSSFDCPEYSSFSYWKEPLPEAKRDPADDRLRHSVLLPLPEQEDLTRDGPVVIAPATMSVSESEENLSKESPAPSALEITCPICLQLFSEPVSLPCGHVYCFACLQAMGEGLDQHSCPECHTTYHGTKALVKSVRMCNMVKTYKGTAKKTNSTANRCYDKEGFQTASGSPECPSSVDQEQILCKAKVEMDEPKFKLASQVTELSLKLEMAEGVLKKEKEWELEVTTANTQLRDKAFKLLGQIKDLSQSYCAKVAQMIEEELGPGEAAICSRVSQASELTKKLRQAVLTAESLLTEDDVTAFNSELHVLQPHIEELMAKPTEEEDHIESKVNPARACPKLENMNAELRERLGDIQRSIRNTLNPSEVTFDPETAHPNLVLSEDLKTVTFSATKQPYPSSPKRFISFFQVLSTQSFSEGDHCWEVELEGAPWIIGVCYSGKLARSGLPSALESSRSSWCLMWFNNMLTAFEQGHDVPLKKTTVSRRLEIKLSFKTHRLSFYNVSPVSGKTHIYTFKAKLSEPVHLAYRMMSGHPKACVTIYS